MPEVKLMQENGKIVEAGEIIEDTRASVSFLRDIARSGAIYEDIMTDDGREGLGCILHLISKDLGKASDLLGVI